MSLIKSLETPQLTAGLALLKEFEESLARCTSIYCDDQLARVAPSLVRTLRTLRTLGTLRTMCLLCPLLV